MSKLATVERVLVVEKHPNADKLDIIKVLGYDCIVGRDQYKEGDLVVFIQPDSILPADRGWAAPLLRYVSRGRIRAVRLRGSWSMGLVLSGEVTANMNVAFIEGEEVSEQLGIVKYEPALPKNTQARGGLPYQIPKTDEDRWQNLRKLPLGELVNVSLKIDGCSFTAYCMKAPGDDPLGQAGITSRSLELKMGTDDNGVEFNSQWHEVERKYGVLDKLKAYCAKYDVALALRGEVYGTGIQAFEKNPHAKHERNVGFYSVYNIRAHRYINPNEQHNVIDLCAELGLPTVPMLHINTILDEELIRYYDSGTDVLDGLPFEGVVVQGQGFSFKIINKFYDSEK